MWGLHCTHRDQSQEGQEESGWGIWFLWTVFLLCVFRGCCVTMCSPSWETWTQAPLSEGKQTVILLLTPYRACKYMAKNVLRCLRKSAMQSTLMLWGVRAFLLLSQVSKIRIEILRCFSSKEMTLSQRSFQNKNGCCLGAFVLMGLFLVWVSVFFKISVYNIKWMMLYFLPA